MFHYLPYVPVMRSAFHASQASNDPDSKVGAVCVTDGLTIVAKACNLVLLDDFATPAEKLLSSAHAEKMAIAAARSSGWTNLSTLTLVVTRMPCSQCMTDIWLSGCKRVVYLDRDRARDTKWVDSFAASLRIAAKFHIDLIKVPLEAFHAEDSDVQDGSPRAG